MDDGWRVGDRVGTDVGRRVGIEDGWRVGDRVGIEVGWRVGNDGDRVGLLVGTSVFNVQLVDSGGNSLLINQTKLDELK